MISSLDFLVEQRQPDTHAVCMDDRFLEDGPSGQIQIAGGAIGIAADIAGATLMRSGNKLPIDDHTVDVYAGAIAKTVFKHSGIELALHSGCAAENALPDVAAEANQAETFDTVFATARAIYPELTERTAERAYAALGALSLANMIRDPNHAADHMKYEAGINRLTIAPVLHASNVIIANHNADLRFDTKAAWNAGVPAYHIGFGAYPAILEHTQSILPTNNDDVLAVSAMRHAATASRLPLPAEAPQFQIHTIG
jgi:hypothetical protein